MAYNNQPGSFWDFVRSLDTGRAGGEGVDRRPQDFEDYEHPPPPFPFGGFGGWGHAGPFGGHGQFGGFGGPGSFGGPGPHGHHHGPRGRFGRRGGRREHSPHGSRFRSPHPERSGSPHDGPREEGFEDHPHPRGHGKHGRRHSRGFEGESSDEHAHPRGHGRRGGRHSRGFGEESSDEHAHPRGPPPFGPHHGGPRGPHGHYRGGKFGGRGGHRGPPPFGGPAGAPFDLSALVGALASHPIAQAFQTYTQQGFGGEEAQRSGETLVATGESENVLTPPVDIFSTPSSYVLHAAIPGAKKEDVGVNWDAEKSELNIAGVVYRQGDEAFLKSLSKAERKVGVFDRSIKLPVGDEKEEVDGDAIVAKLEDGVLVVTVPKVEKEWTEVKRIDIN